MANEKDYIPEGSGTEGQFKEGDDLKNSSKDTLGSFLSAKTTNAATLNEFPIEDAPRTEISLQGSAGRPAEFTTGGQDGNPGFTNTFPSGPGSSETGVSDFDTLSDSGKIETLSDVLNKNAQSDGHSLLRDIVSNRQPGEPGIGATAGASAAADPTKATPLQKKISSMLKMGNRFDPTPGSSPYIEDGQFTEPGIPIEQGAFGVYNDDAVRTSLEDLHKISSSMLVRQAGHAYGNTDPESVSSLSTTGVQMGSEKVGVSRLRPRNAYNAPSKIDLQNAELRFDDMTGDALLDKESYGVLSTYKEPFGKAPLANMNTALQSLAEYLVGAAVFTAITSLVEVLEVGTATPLPGKPHTLKKGSWKKEPAQLRMIRQLGFPSLDRPAWLCFCYGLGAFLKLPPSALPDPSGPPPPIPGGWTAVGAWFTGVLADADSVFFNMLYGAGYYANIMRVMRRDLETMLEEIELATSSSGPDPAIIMFNMITSLNSYPAWNFFTAILRMGDVWLSSYERHIRFASMNTTGQTRQRLSRDPGGSKGLAWRHSSAPALTLLNEKYVNASTVFGYDPTFMQQLHNTIGDTYSRSEKSPYKDSGKRGTQARGLFASKPQAGKRYTSEQVTEIENELDAEYCPFYLHDLRTNEVLGFHAFLGDLKDSYSISYAESGGYGRIDKVKIYQDTTRSISLSWTMVATSPSDFDSMWWSLNKLISMIYPQFSMGKPVTAGSKKFIMPFSQIPTASPVLRLRVGDVIRSNYSRFNLARIFGLSEVMPAPDTEAGATSGTGPAGAEFRAIAGATFDISATAKVDSATAAASSATATAASTHADALIARFKDEPSSYSDVTKGFLPGDPTWGKATLKPGAYTTYDTKAGNVVEVTDGTVSPELAKNKHTANKPDTGATHVSTVPFVSRPSAAGTVTICERIVVPPNTGDAIDQDSDEAKEKPHAEYYVQYVKQDDEADPYGAASAKGHFHTYVVTSADLDPIPPPPPAATLPADSTVTLSNQITDVGDFFKPENNAIVRSFEAAGGRGLAGVITSFDMDWGEAQWDMSGIGRRAPTMLNISISFSPIHDIIPGLDNNGMMRAINYPVGNIAGPLGTDFYDKGGIKNDSIATTGRVPGSDSPNDAARENYVKFAKSAKMPGGE
tara:strand:- start:2199 stop:5615 length:3417 start_codon:yes stop_codon:yes gene_type:complete